MFPASPASKNVGSGASCFAECMLQRCWVMNFTCLGFSHSCFRCCYFLYTYCHLHVRGKFKTLGFFGLWPYFCKYWGHLTEATVAIHELEIKCLHLSDWGLNYCFTCVKAPSCNYVHSQVTKFRTKDTGSMK